MPHMDVSVGSIEINSLHIFWKFNGDLILNWIFEHISANCLLQNVRIYFDKVPILDPESRISRKIRAFFQIYKWVKSGLQWFL